MYSVNYTRLLPESREACIVDLGYGDGDMLEWLSDLGYRNLRGVDSDRFKWDTVRQRLQGVVAEESVTKGDMLDYVGSFPAGAVDMVFMNNAVEHLSKPYLVRLIPEILRVLKPGGSLVAKTGNMENPFNLGLFSRDFTHEVMFAAKSLRHLMEMSGFEPDKVEVHPVRAGVTLFNWPLLTASQVLGWLLRLVARLMLIQITETAALIYCVARKGWRPTQGSP
jgi:SAM-dependent methyltransferase